MSLRYKAVDTLYGVRATPQIVHPLWA